MSEPDPRCCCEAGGRNARETKWTSQGWAGTASESVKRMLAPGGSCVVVVNGVVLLESAASSLARDDDDDDDGPALMKESSESEIAIAPTSSSIAYLALSEMCWRGASEDSVQNKSSNFLGFPCGRNSDTSLSRVRLKQREEKDR